MPRPAKEPGKGAYWTIKEFDKSEPGLNLHMTSYAPDAPPFFIPKMESEDDMYNPAIRSSTGGLHEFMELTLARANGPDMYYRNADAQRIIPDPALEHYYIPNYSMDKGSPKLSHSSSTPVNMSSTDLFYGFEPMFQSPMEHSFGGFSHVPRIVL